MTHLSFFKNICVTYASFSCSFLQRGPSRACKMKLEMPRVFAFKGFGFNKESSAKRPMFERRCRFYSCTAGALTSTTIARAAQRRRRQWREEDAEGDGAYSIQREAEPESMQTARVVKGDGEFSQRAEMRKGFVYIFPDLVIP